MLVLSKQNYYNILHIYSYIYCGQVSNYDKQASYHTAVASHSLLQ